MNRISHCKIVLAFLLGIICLVSPGTSFAIDRANWEERKQEAYDQHIAELRDQCSATPDSYECQAMRNRYRRLTGINIDPGENERARYYSPDSYRPENDEKDSPSIFSDGEYGDMNIGFWHRFRVWLLGE